jgi:hypothetical protein
VTKCDYDVIKYDIIILGFFKLKIAYVNLS